MSTLRATPNDVRIIRAMDGRPIGVFDSGVGGLTVLHELLVTLPHEDAVYFGDNARLPYGPRALAEVRGFALAIGRQLEAEDVKLVVVACNTATAAALPDLQRALARARRRRAPARGARRCARDAEPPCRPARDRGDGAQRPVRGARARARRRGGGRRGPCPRLVPLIEGTDPFGEETTEAVREVAAPLKEAGVDTVILGCTHYPIVRPIFQRVFGRGVTLVFSADETAREVAETLARKGIENGADREGAYRFLTTGDPAAFAEMGKRFLQLPIRDGRARLAPPARSAAA